MKFLNWGIILILSFIFSCFLTKWSAYVTFYTSKDIPFISYLVNLIEYQIESTPDYSDPSVFEFLRMLFLELSLPIFFTVLLVLMIAYLRKILKKLS